MRLENWKTKTSHIWNILKGNQSTSEEGGGLRKVH